MSIQSQWDHVYKETTSSVSNVSYIANANEKQAISGPLVKKPGPEI